MENQKNQYEHAIQFTNYASLVTKALEIATILHNKLEEKIQF